MQFGIYLLFWVIHYNDVIMSAIASQIASLTIVYSIVHSDGDQRKHQTPRHWPLCGEFTGDRWIPRINGQLRGKCFHLMTSSCSMLLFSNCEIYSSGLLTFYTIAYLINNTTNEWSANFKVWGFESPSKMTWVRPFACLRMMKTTVLVYFQLSAS